MHSPRWLVTLAVLSAPVIVEAAPTHAVTLEDPTRDDVGPGEYLYPSDSTLYPRGSFDLTKFEVDVDGDVAIFSVTLGRRVSRPFAAKRTNAAQIALNNGVFVQNIDIYIDRLPGRDVGHTSALPGRNVTIDPDGAWDSAVVITPQPHPTRSMLSEWKPVRNVVFATNVRTVGPKVVARVHIVDLGALPEPSWGYQVVITGARWEPSFDLVNRFVRDRGLNAFTMPVQTLPEDEAFGGGRLDYANPFVIDLLAPPGRTQAGILNSYHADAKELAVIPMVYPNPAAYRAARDRVVKTTLTLVRPAPHAAESRWMDLPVKDVQDDMIILERGDAQLEAYRLGEIIDATGQIKCRAVVTTVHDEFVVATAVKCTSPVERGDRARFDAAQTKD